MGFFRRSRYADGDALEIAGAPVRLRVNPRARGVSLRLDATRRLIVAIAPDVRRLADAVAFAEARQAWIASSLGALPDRPRIAPGATIEVLGEPLRLLACEGRARWSADAAGRALAAPGDGEAYVAAVVRLLKAEARRTLVARTDIHAGALGHAPPTVTLTDAKGRWGSCRPPRRAGFGAALERGRVRYSWRLVLAPFDVLDYVVAHECAHLIEPNHSPRFWRVVDGLVPDAKARRAWLRAHGARLHAFG